jgi:hypothetical protein
MEIDGSNLSGTPHTIYKDFLSFLLTLQELMHILYSGIFIPRTNTLRTNKTCPIRSFPFYPYQPEKMYPKIMSLPFIFLKTRLKK